MANSTVCQNTLLKTFEIDTEYTELKLFRKGTLPGTTARDTLTVHNNSHYKSSR